MDLPNTAPFVRRVTFAPWPEEIALFHDTVNGPVEIARRKIERPRVEADAVGEPDSVEPLMDKELRYSRVAIVASTESRVHVRWKYQSCDFNYKVWGDSAVEDFYFYPDGFGTRVVTLTSTPGRAYELIEFIILTSQSTYPLSVLPPDVSVTGGRYEGWQADLRAHRITVVESAVAIRIKPRVPCVNPVFDLTRVNDTLSAVAVNGHRLLRKDYAWDGRTLWLDTDITSPTTLRLTFAPR